MMPSLQALQVIGQYNLHKKEIAEKNCENRKRPKTRCHGKCYMMKRLAAQEKKNKPVQADQTCKGQVLSKDQNKTKLQAACRNSFELPFRAGVEPLQEFHQPVYHPPC